MHRHSLALLLLPTFTNAIYIGLNGQLSCSRPFSTTATVFLMEQDFGRTIFDEIDDDDVIAHKEVSINKPFSLGGEDFEMSGLEPYVYLRYNCNGDYQEEVINLGDSLFTSRVFTLMKNLDTGETIIV